MIKSLFYIKNNIINFTFLILFSLYLLLFPFYIDLKSIIENLLFVVVLFFFYINLFFLLKNISRDKNYFSMFLVGLFQFWLLVFLFINIENLFFWDGYLHAKYFYLNFLIYAFHGIAFLVLSVFLYKTIGIFNNKEKRIYITIIFSIFLIYNILPSIKIPYVPSNFFILNKVENEYIILKQDYNSEERNHFLNNSEYYIDKFKNNGQYKYLLKKDLYNYEFNNSVDGLKSTISVPFFVNYSDLIKYERSKYYYNLLNGRDPILYIPTIGKYPFSNLFIKSGIGSGFHITENRLNNIYNELEEILD